MPVLKVEFVETPGSPPPRDLARRVADAVAVAQGAAPRSVWVRLVSIARREYAENGGEDGDAAPVFVTIIEREPPRDAALATEVAAVTKAIASACGRSESDIHLIYEPPGRGRLAFGGRLVS